MQILDKSPDLYIPRTLESIVVKAFNEFPAVILTGPRQSGKTTLLKHLYENKIPFISLELPDVQAAAIADPRGFLDFYPPPVIFDEIQNAPNLFPYIKEQIDLHRDKTGQYILTGSQNLLLMQQISETLAGRSAVLSLLPLTQFEMGGQPQKLLPWEAGSHTQDYSKDILGSAVWDRVLRGFYPELAREPQRDARLWFGSYIQTYLERDVRNLRNLGNLTLFQTYLRALASRSAQLLNLSELARDVGVSVNTAKDWLSILEASFQVFLLRPYFANIGKRLVKSPKVYFIDTGVLCYLVGLRDTEHAESGPMGGALFENLIVAEIYKAITHRGEEPAMYFWRTAAGSEVDLIISSQGKLFPVEIKSTATPRPEMAAKIGRFRSDFRAQTGQGYLVHSGNITLPLGSGVLAVPFSDI